MICTSCENLTIDRLYARASEYVPKSRSGWKQTGYLEHHRSYECLKRAAEDGCTNCQAFHERFVDLGGGVQGLRKRLASLAKSRGPPFPIIVFLQMGFNEGGKYPIHKLRLQVGEEPLKPGVGPLGVAFKISRLRGGSTSLSIAPKLTRPYSTFRREQPSRIRLSIHSN